MESVRNVIDSALSALKDRLLNPFYVAYVLAWSALNFRLILVLVGAGTPESKIGFIDQVLYPDWRIGLTRGLVIPFAAAVIYVLASPFIFRWVTLYQRKIEKSTLEQVFRVLGETPMPKAQADKIRANLRDSKARHEQQISEAHTEIDQLHEHNRRLQFEIDALRSESSSVGSPTSMKGVNPTDSAPADVAVAADKPKRIFFSESEFEGFQLSDVRPLQRRGISALELNLLYELRNAPTFTASQFAKFVDADDEFTLRGLAEGLSDMKLIDPIKSMEAMTGRETMRYRMSKLGRLVVKLGIESGDITST